MRWGSSVTSASVGDGGTRADVSVFMFTLHTTPQFLLKLTTRHFVVVQILLKLDNPAHTTATEKSVNTTLCMVSHGDKHVTRRFTEVAHGAVGPFVWDLMTDGSKFMKFKNVQNWSSELTVS